MPSDMTREQLERAVQEASWQVDELFQYDGRIEKDRLAALITAARAAGYAEAMERGCVWRREPFHESTYIVAACEGHTAMMRLDIRHIYCPSCGGKVRVEEAPDART